MDPHLLRVLNVYEMVEVDHAVAAGPALCQGRGCEQRPALDAGQTAVREACPGDSARYACSALRLTSGWPQRCWYERLVVPCRSSITSFCC